MGPRSVAILPARLGSTRLPRKVLLADTGTPLFVHTVQNTARCREVDRIIVATDSEEVLEVARRHDIQAVMTRTDHQSGTDRVREALDQLKLEPEVVLNVQADEPDLEPADLAKLIEAFYEPQCEAATLSVTIDDPADIERASVVKVVCDQNGRALYFSRSPLPNRAHVRPGAPALATRRHLGVYAFRPHALRAFCDLPPSPLEQIENLEQLRWLEHGHAMYVLPATRAPRGIDTPEDYAEFTARAARAQDSPQ
ncbi:MAG: 3-deoxy-manno-octulosonate cytidylyltransferase [Planctomycetota bacterium]